MYFELQIPSFQELHNYCNNQHFTKKKAAEIAVIWNAALAVYMQHLGLCILIDFSYQCC